MVESQFQPIRGCAYIGFLEVGPVHFKDKRHKKHRIKFTEQWNSSSEPADTGGWKLGSVGEQTLHVQIETDGGGCSELHPSDGGFLYTQRKFMLD